MSSIIERELLEAQKGLGKLKAGGWDGIKKEFWDMLKDGQMYTIRKS